MSDLSTQIATDAAKAASTSADGISVSRRSLTDQIAADKYLASVEATKSGAKRTASLKSMISRIVPPGGH